MHKLFKKGIAATMGLALSLTCLVVAAVPVQAAEKSYKATEMKLLSDDTMGDVVIKTEGDNLKVTFPAQYNQIFFEIPAEIKAAGLVGVDIEVEGEKVGVKFNDRNAEGGAIRGVVYNGAGTSVKLEESALDQWGGSPAATKDDFDGVIMIDIMNQKSNDDGENTIVVKNFKFETTNAVAGGDDKKEEDNKTEEKPAETKPAETKPAETKPAETKPAKTADVSVASWMGLVALGCVVLLAGSGAVIMDQRKRK